MYKYYRYETGLPGKPRSPVGAQGLAHFGQAIQPRIYVLLDSARFRSVRNRVCRVIVLAA